MNDRSVWTGAPARKSFFRDPPRQGRAALSAIKGRIKVALMFLYCHELLPARVVRFLFQALSLRAE